MKRITHFASLATVLVALVACFALPAGAAELKELKIAFRQSKLPAFNSLKHLPFLEFLESHVGIPVKIRVGKDYQSVITSLAKGDVQVAFLGPFSYVLAHETTKGNVEPLVVGVRKSVRERVNSSIIVASDRSRVTDPSQFNKTHIFTVPDPASTSGYLVPFYRLMNLGLDPETDFKGIHIAGNHTAALMRVQNGLADGGASNMQTYEALLRSGMIDIDKVRIIWRSPNLPGGPVTVRTDLSGDLKYRLLKAFMTMPMQLGTYEYEGEIDHFTPAFDRQYNVIRGIRRQLIDSGG
jgi:phosphonate transport system substrate-binding protein